MPRKVFELFVAAEIQAVWDFHSSVKALEALTPPDRKLQLISKDLRVAEGAHHVLRVKVGPFWRTWDALISEVDPPRGFRDTAVRCPFKSWTHHHEFISQGGGTLVRDTVEYELPFGPLGQISAGFVAKDIDRLFAYRHEATKRALER